MQRGWILVMLLTLGLAGCGSSPPVRLFPPELSVAEVRLSEGGAVAVLRLRSFATVGMKVSSVQGQLLLGTGAKAIPLSLTPNLQVAATSVELIEMAFEPDADLRSLIERSLGERRALDYRIEAEVASSEPVTRFEIEYRSSLAPAPGLPGVLR